MRRTPWPPFLRGRRLPLAITVLAVLAAGALGLGLGLESGLGLAGTNGAIAQAIGASPAVAAVHKPPPSPACGPSPTTLVTQGGMVWVPGGRFTPGDEVYPEERPAGTQTVPGFWMDRTEVSNDDFAAFVHATGHVTVAERPVDASRLPAGAPAAWRRPGALVFRVPQALRPDSDPRDWWHYVPGANWRHPLGPGSSIDGRGKQPVVAVTLEDAQAYARWRGRRLPTEAEWEWAAREARADGEPSSTRPPQAANTWQGRFPLRDTGDDGHAGVAPVACYTANALGLHDMLGNVWELTSSAYAAHGAPPPAGPPRRDNLPAVVIKGGSFLCAANYCMRYRPGARQGQERDLATSHVGFRTVSDAPGPEAAAAAASRRTHRPTS